VSSPAYAASKGSGQTLTISSLQGNYLYVVIQVTRDLHPVVYFDWLLPGIEFELGVADVTLAQFEALAEKLGRNDVAAGNTVGDWAGSVSRSMISLDKLLKVLPLDINTAFDLAYPSQTTRASLSIRRLDLNSFVDSVLQTIFNVSDLLETPDIRRKLTFISFSSDVCSALNWKQPNYPVFFGCICGKDGLHLPSPTAWGSGNNLRRMSCVGVAIEFAKANNLLGIFVDSDLLVEVPSLIDGIRSVELLVGVHGASEKLAQGNTGVMSDGDCSLVDASIRDGVISFVDYSIREMA